MNVEHTIPAYNLTKFSYATAMLYTHIHTYKIWHQWDVYSQMLRNKGYKNTVLQCIDIVTLFLAHFTELIKKWNLKSCLVLNSEVTVLLYGALLDQVVLLFKSYPLEH